MKQDDPEAWMELIRQHKQWYPLMKGRDVYKLLYQGEMGPEHLVHSAEDFIKHLEAEYASLADGEQERILEPVRPDHGMWRINLHACKTRDITPDRLIAVLLETGKIIAGDPDQVRKRWTSFVHACEQGKVKGFTLVDVQEFGAWLENLDYPTVHHSNEYRQEYHPAYRLVADIFLSRIGLDHAD